MGNRTVDSIKASRGQDDGRYIIIRTERWEWQHGQFDITARVVEKSGDSFVYVGGEFQSLEVSARVEDAHAVVPAGRVQYGLQFSVGLQDARGMVQTLGKIDRAMRRLYERRGEIRDFADHVQRFGESVGAQGLIVGDGESFQCWAFYDAQCVIDSKVNAEEVDHIKR